MDLGRYGQVLKGGLGIVSSVIAIFVASKQEPVQKFVRQWTGPSYSCADRRILNAAETAVCDSNQLARLDVRLSDAYYDACGNLDKTLAAEEVSWLKSVRDACELDQSCLERAYNERLPVLAARAKKHCP